jgi:putative ABC transport system permease protein
MFEDLRQGVAQALRNLGRAPAFAVAVVLTLALGIGGSSLMFTAVNAAFFRPLPYPDEEELVLVWQTSPQSQRVPVSMLTSRDWASLNQTFEQLSTFGSSTVNVTSSTNPMGVTAAYVTGQFFTTLGVHPRIGRAFSDNELAGQGSSIIISDHLWRQAFHSNPGAMTRTLDLEGIAYPVAGVMPAGFTYPEGAQIWLPLPLRDGTGRSANNYSVVGRLRPGVSLGQAQADMASVADALAREHPTGEAGLGVRVVPLRLDLLGTTGPVVLLLQGAVSLVLLIACANVTNLLLARAFARRAEISLRLALGGCRLSALRPFVIESLLLSVCGGALGLVLAASGASHLTALAPPTVLDSASLTIGGNVWLFTLLLSLVVGLVCGLVPAIRLSRRDLRPELSAASRATGGNRGMEVLVAVEVAIAYVLLVGAGLMLRSSWQLAQIDPGFQPRGVTVLRFAMGGLPSSHYNDPEWRSSFFNELLGKVTELASVAEVGLINELPLSGRSSEGSIELESSEEGRGLPLRAHYRLIGGHYLAAMGVPLLAGEDLIADARSDGPMVALVNEQLAQHMGGVDKAIGRRVSISELDAVEGKARVVGVIANVRHRGLRFSADPEVYFPFSVTPRPRPS